MSIGAECYLVRHGSYDYDDGSLDLEGRTKHAPAARDELIAFGLGTNALILTSDAPRAVETALIIGEGLGVFPKRSKIIREAGNSWTVPDLDVIVDEALKETGVTIDDHNELIVVTHAPMLAIARKKSSADDIRFGEVFEYIRGTWDNPGFPKHA